VVRRGDHPIVVARATPGAPVFTHGLTGLAEPVAEVRETRETTERKLEAQAISPAVARTRDEHRFQVDGRNGGPTLLEITLPCNEMLAASSTSTGKRVNVPAADILYTVLDSRIDLCGPGPG